MSRAPARPDSAGRSAILVLVLLSTAALALSCVDAELDPTPPPSPAPAPRAQILEVPGEEAALVAARQIMQAARYCALITTDASGQPRARTVDPRAPDADFVVRLVTHPATRKVAQIAANPKVTLYYFDSARAEYATVMGTASMTRDPEVIARYWSEEWSEFYPDRPNDVVLIEVTPRRLEVLGRGIDPDPVTWTPQGLDFPSSP